MSNASKKVWLPLKDELCKLLRRKQLWFNTQGLGAG